MQDPKKLLSSVIELIERDIKHIKASSANGKLDHDYASDLVRYSKALLEIIGQQEIDRKEEKEQLSKLSLQELKAIALRSLKKQDDTE